MLREFTTFSIVAALVCTLVVSPHSATAQLRRDTEMAELTPFTKAETGTKNLPADMAKLVAEVRAEGNVVKVPRPQIQAPQRNNLSTGAKIAIGVAIAVAVVVVVLVAQRCNNEPGSC